MADREITYKVKVHTTASHEYSVSGVRASGLPARRRWWQGRTKYINLNTPTGSIAVTRKYITAMLVERED